MSDLAVEEVMAREAINNGFLPPRRWLSKYGDMLTVMRAQKPSPETGLNVDTYKQTRAELKSLTKSKLNSIKRQSSAEVYTTDE